MSVNSYLTTWKRKYMMEQKPDQKWEQLYELSKHPGIYFILGAILISHTIVLIILISWWLILLDILLILVAIAVAFILGVGFIPVWILSSWTKTPLPWPYRIVLAIAGVVMAPFVWFSERGEKQKPQSETDKNVQSVIDRIHASAEKRENEPPTQSAH